MIEDAQILVIEDEEVLAWSIEKELAKQGALCAKATTIKVAEELLQAQHFDLIISDIRLPDGDGMEFMQNVRKDKPNTPFIIMTAHGGTDSAIQALRLKAFDYLTKPFAMNDLIIATSRALEMSRLRETVKQMEGRLAKESKLEIIGRSKAMVQLRRSLERIAATQTDTVTVYGETGCGKELAARALHEWSEASKRPYVEINCASIPENLLESELFGYERGAFTDARSRKLGLFEVAKNGTLFLDEIGEMPLKLQSKLLRALEYRKFKRLGGVDDITFEARIVAATNRNLLQEVEQGRFRADLYYRLNVIPVYIPALREHKDDISALVDHFLKDSCTKLKMKTPKVEDEVIDLLKSHDWPGNIRELKNTIHRALVLHDPVTLKPSHITLDHLHRSPEIDHLSTTTDSVPLKLEKPSHAETEFTLPKTGVSLENLEKSLLTQALVRTQYNQSKAAQLLKISRHTLRYRLEKHGLLQK